MRSRSIHVLDLGDICDKERKFRSNGVSLGDTHVICLRTPTSYSTEGPGRKTLKGSTQEIRRLHSSGDDCPNDNNYYNGCEAIQ